MMIGKFVFTVERRDICFHCGEKRHWAKEIVRRNSNFTRLMEPEAGMEEREEPATSNRERDREEHITHLEGECTTPTQTLIIDVKDLLEKKDKLLIANELLDLC